MKSKDLLKELQNHLESQEKKITKLKFLVLGLIRNLENAKEGKYNFERTFMLDRGEWQETLDSIE